MVGRDGRNLLRVKKRWVESSSSAPPRAKYLLLMLQECGRLPVAKLLCGGIHGDKESWLRVEQQSRPGHL